MGNLLKAENVDRQALILWRKVGGSHVDVACSIDNLGIILLDEGDWKQALDMSRKLGGEEHPEVARSLIEVALARELQGDAAGAEPLLNQGLEIREKLFSPGHTAIVEAETLLGETLIDERKLHLAEPILRQAVNSAATNPFRWQVAVPEDALGVCLAQEGHIAAADKQLESSRAALESYPESAVRRWMPRHQTT
jgi:tetratricopeptide (TPR) repeat protein